ncbi:hypothetical protein LCGC14_2356260 [marine sediment metagenome]|uniref:Uncharacterized protein n=1 Tax=marine sediment metagenome TaxID=412755 RepID=A0A0F9C7M9_9ZZZZ
MDDLILLDNEIHEAICDYVSKKYNRKILTTSLYKRDEIFKGDRLKRDEAFIILRSKNV